MNEKKAKSKVRRIIKYIILILIVVIPISAIMIKYVPKKVAEKRYINNLKYGLNAPTKEEWIESLKNQQSDIDGKTLYDLYEMGLVPAIGADSDYDGLTDKEEIEVYHTDPLKASTSGDLYSDSYKVLNDMDLTKYYEYKEEQVFSHMIEVVSWLHLSGRSGSRGFGAVSSRPGHTRPAAPYSRPSGPTRGR